MSTTIEVTAIRPPKEGKKVATVVAATGQSYEIWPDKMAGIREGGRYEVEVKEREWNSRTIRQIVKAKEVMSTEQSKQGIDTRPQSSATAGAEQAFVATLLNGAIIGGHVKLEAADLERAARLFQMLYSQSFGGHNTFRASEASALSQFRGTQQ